MNTNPEKPSGYADLLGSDSDQTLRRLVDDLDALYSAPVPPAHLTVPRVIARPVTTPTPDSSVSWVPLPDRGGADPRRAPILRPLAWQPLLRVAALTVLLLGGLLTVVLGMGGPGLPGGPTRLTASTATPAPDRFAQLALQYTRPTPLPGVAPPVVVLNRRLRVADLPCLGLGSVPGLPADEALRLVILHGDNLSPAVPGPQMTQLLLSYVGFVYVERQAAMTMAMGSRNGGIFRVALNDPTLPDDDIWISHSLVRWAQTYPDASRVVAGDLGQALHESQTQGVWAVALERVYADTNRVVLLYTVRGPTARATISPPMLALPIGQEVRLLGANWDGPIASGQDSTWRVLAVFDARDLSPAAQWTLRVTVPAIYGIPATPTPPLPACGPALPAPGTPLPTWTPGPPAPPVATATVAAMAPPGLPVTAVPTGTAEPRDGLAGPFTFTLTVPVIPSTPLPQPPPTAPVRLPQAVPSGVPSTPLPSPR